MGWVDARVGSVYLVNGKPPVVGAELTEEDESARAGRLGEMLESNSGKALERPPLVHSQRILRVGETRSAKPKSTRTPRWVWRLYKSFGL